jgi:hypothetical protein
MANQGLRKMKKAPIVGLALLILGLAGLLIARSTNVNPETAFKRYIAVPVPSTVRLIKEAHKVTMDSALVVLHFHISNKQLRELMEVRNFAPLDDHKEFKVWDATARSFVPIRKEEYLAKWMHRIRLVTQMDLSLPDSTQIYTRKEKGRDDYIFAATNSDEVVFVLDAH